MGMARYKVILAYDGTDFQGYQRQGKTRTVQLVVEAALVKLGWEGKTILTAGRTDSGVHAAGQVVAFDLDWTHSMEELVRALNANLPDDVAVKAGAQAADDFHPRYDAVARTYRYRIHTTPQRDPLRERFSWRVWPPVELEALQSAARLIPGSHDFAAFGSPPKAGGSTQRIVYSTGWCELEGGLVFEIIGNAFLYHMVRRLVFVQVQIGQERISLDDLKRALAEVKALPPGLAPAHGLALSAVSYADHPQDAVLF
jgi:tRNA pseudouridine38-40 synthase